MEQNKKSIIVEVILGLLLLFVSFFVFLSYYDNNYDNNKIKEEIDSHFDQADIFFKNGQFEEAIDRYNKILEISNNKFPYEYSLAQNNLGSTYGSLRSFLKYIIF